MMRETGDVEVCVQADTGDPQMTGSVFTALNDSLNDSLPNTEERVNLVVLKGATK